MANIGFDISKASNEKFRTFLEKKGISIFDLLRAAFDRLYARVLNDNDAVYTYNPLSENKRKKLEQYIKTYFKNKAEFARASGVDPTMLSSLLVNRRRGNALTWKKINDAFESFGVKLPYDLQIKYEVVNCGATSKNKKTS